MKVIQESPSFDKIILFYFILFYFIYFYFFFFKMDPNQSSGLFEQAQAFFEKAVASNTGNTKVITQQARTYYLQCVHQG